MIYVVYLMQKLECVNLIIISHYISIKNAIMEVVLKTNIGII